MAENDKFYAFLDINPLQKGHTLVVPKLAEPEADYIFDLEDDMLSEMLVFAKQVARGIKGAVECKRVGVAVIGLEVPHVHMHLIPISKEGDMSFANKKMTLPSEEMAEIANLDCRSNGMLRIKMTAMAVIFCFKLLTQPCLASSEKSSLVK